MATTEKYTHVYLGYNKTYFLKEVKRTRRGKINFEVVSVEHVKKTKTKSSLKKLTKWKSDVNLHLAEEWNDSLKEIVRFGKHRFLKRKINKHESHHIPHKFAFSFDPKMMENILLDIRNDHNIFIVSVPGLGKCLAEDSEIEILLNEDENIQFQEFLLSKMITNGKNNMKKIKIKIGDLFEFIFQKEKHKFEENQEFFQKTPIKIQDENGNWIDVKALITKKDKIRTLEFENGDEIKTADRHLICVDKKNCRQISELQIGDKILKANDERIKVKNSSLSEKEETVYDMMVDSPTHLYQTANGIIHHNSTMFQQIAARLNTPCVRIQTSSGVTPESFVGGYVPSPDGKGMWVDGLLTQAARNGWWVILDEWDFCPAHIRTITNPVLESGNRQLILTDKDGGEILTRENGKMHRDFRVFATGNAAGMMQDEAEYFGGAAEHNAAQLSRWNVYKIDYPEDKVLFKIIRNAVPELSSKGANQIVKAARSVINAKIPGVFFSTRVALAIGHKMKYHIKFMDAINPVLLNHLGMAERRRIMQLLTDQSI